MKRRTFMQTVVGAIAAVFMPKANVPKKSSIAAHPMEIAYDIDIDYFVVKLTPEELRKRYIEGPSFNWIPYEYKESLDG